MDRTSEAAERRAERMTMRRLAQGLDRILADPAAAAARMDAALLADPTLLAGPTLADILDSEPETTDAD